MKREEKGWRELMEKQRGTNGFITCQRIGLADGARPDAIPNAAGGEGGHGAATPDVATHRYSYSHYFYPTVAVCITFMLRFIILMMTQKRRWVEEGSMESAESTPSLGRQPRNTFENRGHVSN
jgi:hypothetical protein